MSKVYGILEGIYQDINIQQLFDSLRFDDENSELLNDRKTIFSNIQEDMVEEAKMVTFSGKVYPKFNNAVVMSGGSGSGKSYALKNLVGIEGKVINVDDLKDLYVRALQAGRLKDASGRVSFNFKDSEDVSYLHNTIKQKKFKDKQEKAFFDSHENGERPNVIYDITGDESTKLKKIGKTLKDLGYYVTLIWVVTNRELALKRNLERSRVVSQEVFHSTHNGLLQNTLPFLRSADASVYNSAWVIFSSLNSAKNLTPEQAKELNKVRAVKLEKSGSQFVIPKKVEQRILDTLGPEEPNPSNPEVYKSYDSISSDSNLMKRVESGDASLLQ